MTTTTKKNPPVQQVHDVTLEERLDKVILLIEAQNKAWQKCLTLLTEMSTLMFEKYKSADLLLEDHPPVKAPSAEPVTVGAARQPQPFNNYSDSLPYGGELEEEREAPAQSFPARAQTDTPQRPTEYTQEESPPEYDDEPVPGSATPYSAEPRLRVAPGPPVSSKAELLERVEKVS